MFTSEQMRAFSDKYGQLYIVYGVSRAKGTYGQSRISLITGKRKYAAVGRWDDLSGRVVAKWLNDCPEFLKECEGLAESEFPALQFHDPLTGVSVDGEAGLPAVMDLFHAVTGRYLVKISANRRNGYYHVSRKCNELLLQL